MKKFIATALAVSALLLGGVAAAAPAQASPAVSKAADVGVNPLGACSAGYYYRSTGRGADTFGAVGTQQSDYNGTATPAIVTFTSKTSGTVSATYSGSTNVALSVEIASISSTYGISASVSKTVTLGNSIQFTVPAHKTGNGTYGAYKAYVTGVEEWWTNTCVVTSSYSKTIYSPYKVGWNIWIS
ncbi:hypothetical protein ACPPVQ_18970 [Diaminobutyricibacter sp. McL0618]|uniref:hypothetical protein n=1 Tax=Leifsonia sp. McL0618 TaxID=3415677 RepID=UPI003CF76FF4